MKKQNNNCCENCKGNLRCWNPGSPNYLSYCGEYPNTGPKNNNKKGKKGNQREK